MGRKGVSSSLLGTIFRGSRIDDIPGTSTAKVACGTSIPPRSQVSHPYCGHHQPLPGHHTLLLQAPPPPYHFELLHRSAKREKYNQKITFGAMDVLVRLLPSSGVELIYLKLDNTPKKCLCVQDDVPCVPELPYGAPDMCCQIVICSSRLGSKQSLLFRTSSPWLGGRIPFNNFIMFYVLFSKRVP